MTCIVSIIGLLLISLSPLLPALFPALRKWTRSHYRLRQILIFLPGLLTGLMSFGLLAWLGAEMEFVFMTLRSHPEYEDTPEMRVAREKEWKNKPTIINELWLRDITPPPLQVSCHTNDRFACNFIAERHRGDSGFMSNLGIGFIAGLICTSLAWYFTK